jgi:hypothetical protein
MGRLDDLVREMVEKVVENAGKKNIEDTYTEVMEKRIETFEWKLGDNKLASPEFHDDYIDHCMKSVGLVWCVECGKFIDDEKHDIKHTFARNSKEIREKSILARMSGDI